MTESERLERGEQVKWVECMVQDEAGKWEKRDLGGKDDEDGNRKDIQIEGREMKRVMLGWIPLKGNIAPSFKAHGLDLTVRLLDCSNDAFSDSDSLFIDHDK